MKTIGIIGGMGWESTVTYYRVMNELARVALGGWHSARIIVDSLQWNEIAQAHSPEQFDQVKQTLVASAKRLERAGADALVIACNTVHRFAPQVRASVAIPLLHIADASGAALRTDGHTRIGLLGTQATMQGGFIRRRLADEFGMEVLTPPRETQQRLNDLILNDLVSGGDPQLCAPHLDRMVVELAEAGASAVLLACTDFGLAFGVQDAPCFTRDLPLYDSAVLHAQAAMDFALAS